MTRRPLVSVLLALLAGGAHAHEDHHHAAQPAAFTTERLSLPNVPVTDRFGTADGFLDRFAGAGPLLVSFSYTQCRTVCPLTNAVLAEVQDELTAAGYSLVTVSIDPLHDTPAAMAAAAEAFGAGPSWHWLAASPADTPALLDALGVPPGPVEDHVPQVLVGDLASGDVVRILGLPEVDALLAFAR